MEILGRTDHGFIVKIFDGEMSRILDTDSENPRLDEGTTVIIGDEDAD